MQATDDQTVDFEDCVAFYRHGDNSRTKPALARWLQAHPVVAERAQRHAAMQQQLQHHYDPVFEEPIPRRLLIGSQRPHSRWPARIAVAATLALTVSSTWWLQAGDGWNKPPRRPVAQPAPHTTPVHEQATRATTTTIRHPDLSAHGYQLMTTRVVQTTDTPTLAFTYVNQHGAQVRIYAQPQSQRLGHTKQKASVMSRVHWYNNGVAYTLVGRLPEHSLQVLAQSAQHNSPVRTVSQQKTGQTFVSEPHPSRTPVAPSSPETPQVLNPGLAQTTTVDM